MMTGWQMYWLLMLDNVMVAGAIITVITGMGMLASVIFWGISADDNEEERAEMFKKSSTWLTIIFVLFLFSGMFLPSTRQMAAIVVVPKIVNNKDVQEIPENLLKLANGWIEDKTKELKGD